MRSAGQDVQEGHQACLRWRGCVDVKPHLFGQCECDSRIGRVDAARTPGRGRGTTGSIESEGMGSAPTNQRGERNGAFSIWHWIILLLWICVFGVPFWRIVGRTGNSAALSLLLLVPIANIMFLWWMAFGKWSVINGDADTAGGSMNPRGGPGGDTL